MLKKRALLTFLITGIIALMLLTACSETLVNEGQRLGKDELILAIGSEPEGGFDPTTGWGRYGSPLFQSTILRRDNDLNIVNDLASAYEVSDDGLIWEVKLREDVSFSDGEALTAADVVYTFNTAAQSASLIDLNIMEKAEALDEYTIRFYLKKPQSTFINSLISIGIVPKHVHGDRYAEQPIGSGPFKFIQWDKGQQLIVEPNPDYYGLKSDFNKITFLFLSEDAAFAAAKAGQVHMAQIPASFAKQNVSGMKVYSLESVDNRGIMFPFVKSGAKTEDGLSIGNDVTADLAIRKAINIAVDRQALVDGVLEGQGTAAFIGCDGLPWWNSETVIEDGNLEEAKRVLEEGGWADNNDDGILEKNALKAEFILMYPTNDQIRQSLAMVTADMLKPLGISIKAEGKSWDEIRLLMHSTPILFGWGSHDSIEMYNLYSSNTAGSDWYNSGFYKNPVVDEYMEKALAARSEEEANEYWKKAQWDGNTGFSAKGDAPWAWLVNINHLYLVNEKLDIGKQKIQPHGHGWPVTDNIAEWKWID